MIYALDTNIITYCLKELYGIEAKIADSLNTDNLIIIPPITFFETLRGLFAVNATKKLRNFETMCEMLGVGDIQKAELIRASWLYAMCKKNGTPMEDADLLHAAYCMKHNYILSLFQN